MTKAKTNIITDPDTEATIRVILDQALCLDSTTPRQGFDHWLAAGILAGDLLKLAMRPHSATASMLRAAEITRTLSILSLAGSGTGHAADKRRLLSSWIHNFGGMCSRSDTAAADAVLNAWAPNDDADRLLFELTAKNETRVRLFFRLSVGRHGLDESMQTMAWLRSKPESWIREAVRLGVPDEHLHAGADRILERARLSPRLTGWPGETDGDLDDYRAEALAGLALLGRFQDAMTLADPPQALAAATILLPDDDTPGLSGPGAKAFAVALLDAALTRDGRWAKWQRKELTDATRMKTRTPKSDFGQAVAKDGRMTAAILTTFNHNQNWSIDVNGLAWAMTVMPSALLSQALREGGPKRLKVLQDIPEIAAVIDRKALRAAAARASPRPSTKRTM